MKDKMQPKEQLALIMEQLQATLLLTTRHCYTRQLVSPAKRCVFCKKTMFLVTLRCKDCRVRCHKRCAEQAASLCQIAAEQKLTEGHNATSTPAIPECHTRLQFVKKIKGYAPVTHHQRTSSTNSTESFREYNPHQPGFSARRFATRTRLSLSSESSGTPANRKDRTAIRVSRSTISSESSMRSSVSGYHSLESDASILSECDTPRELSVFDSFGTCEVTSPVPHHPGTERRSDWIDRKSTTVSTSVDRADRECCRVPEGGETSPLAGASLVGTWPLDRRCHPAHYNSDNTEDEDTESDRVEDFRLTPINNGEDLATRSERLKEWTIPHSDLKYGRRLATGIAGSTFKGHWHGEVVIQTRDASATNMDDFLDEVSMLSMIRHENIALFMGACVEPGRLAVVHSIHRGPSLFQHVHVHQKMIPTPHRVHIARQVAHAMGYLHARGIIVAHLNSSCIYLESKVKLSVTQSDVSDVTCQRPGYASLPKGHLSYLAPELLAESRVAPPELIIDSAQTQLTDVYAYGTILFEIMAGRWPFQHACAESVIYQTCTGKRDDFSRVSCASNIKSLVYDCWAQNPAERPSFPEIVTQLKKSVAMTNMKHSLSEPDNLNRIGSSFPW